jgi:hypothetical protein
MQRAVEIASNLTSNEYVAVTLAGGYAVRPDGSRYLFEPCRVREMKRNDQGRCTKLVGTYYDGSTITFTYSENRGAKYRGQNSGPDARSEYPDNAD